MFNLQMWRSIAFTGQEEYKKRIYISNHSFWIKWWSKKKATDLFAI